MTEKINFRGKIFQTVEALDYGDAISNQVILLGDIFSALGFETSIHTKWHNSKVAALRSDLEDMHPDDEDIVVLHYGGYSDHMVPYVQSLRCTKIFVYHNITPHEFFSPGSDLYQFCKKGREQLAAIIGEFHYFWGDSRYNLEELIQLGVDENKCSLVPIIIDPPAGMGAEVSNNKRQSGVWMFLGRIAGNKGQLDLVDCFYQVRKEHPDVAQALYIVGGYNPDDSYYKSLLEKIKSLDLGAFVKLTGKISDEEVEEYFSKASIYISMSRHEGFGVPLIEASNHGLPVVALANTAVSETLGNKSALAVSQQKLKEIILDIHRNAEVREQLLKHQRVNARRFTYQSVMNCVSSALRLVFPTDFKFLHVSVVVCTYNRGELLERCLDYLRYQTNQNFEVIVVNGPSTDNTDEVIKKYQSRIKVAINPDRNLSISRNIGIELSSGDIVAFIDDDAIPFDDWIETILYEFNHRPLTHAALGGPAYFAGTLKFQSEDIAINRYSETKVNVAASEIGKDGWERSMLGTNTCFRADILRAVKGFDEQFDYFLDESELSFRLQKNGYIVGYAPSLYLRHEFAQSDNRKGKYKFNWFTICKNTAYFIAAYSGFEGEKLKNYVLHRMQLDRIQNLDNGVKAGEISKSEYDKYVDEIHRGVEQGLLDFDGFPRVRTLNNLSEEFKTYTCAAASPLVGRDIDRLHVCIVTKEFPPFVPGGGIGTLYYHLASELLLMGHYVTVVAPGEFPDVYTQGRFSLHYITIKNCFNDEIGAAGFVNNMNWSASAFCAVSAINQNHHIDVIDSALWDSEGLAISLIKKEQRPPVVVRLVTPFGVAEKINRWHFSDKESGLIKEAEKRLIQNADVVVPISDSIGSTIESLYGIQRDVRWRKSYCGISYWPSFDPFKDYFTLSEINGKSVSFSEDRRLILFLGRLESRKGVDLVLAAANDFLAADSNSILVLAGKDCENFVSRSKQILEKRFVDRVIFLGAVDDSTRDKLLHIAFCLVFPSRYESFGLVPLEAFVHGVPVVAARAGAIPEVVEDQVCGLLFESDNVQSLADSVKRLLLEPGLRSSLSKGARTQIRRFSSRTAAIGTMIIYKSLLPAKARVSVADDPYIKTRIEVKERTSSCSFSGGHPRLFTQCGIREPDEMRTKGAEGFLVYGPYVDLPQGNYRLIVYGNSENIGITPAYFEILTNSGGHIVSSGKLSRSEFNSNLIEKEFNLDQPSQVEVRIWVSSEAVISIRKISFLAEEDW